MPKSHRPLHVILDKAEIRSSGIYRPFHFEPTQRLYLELLENKDKVKKELRDKEYIPPQEFIEQEEKKSKEVAPLPIEHSIKKESHQHHHRHHNHHRRHHEKPKHRHESKSPLKEILKNHERSSEKKGVPPSLAEIESGMKGDGRLHVSQYSSLGNTEELARKKILMRKLDIFRKNNSTIPTYTDLTDLSTLEQDNMIYERQSQIETSIDSYKKYLIVAFTGIEWFIGYMIGLDARGLADAQMKNMKPYNDLLVELSEKTYVSPDKRFPVEVRLLVAIMLNTIFFLFTKMITDNMSKVIGGFMQPQQHTTTKMKGPNSDDLADILGSAPSVSPVPNFSHGVLPETLRFRKN